ncbi:MAG: pyruvate kinase, partial [Clostridiales bacterium]|nr:pyruvate kinase [Clostridiales bacterium]
TALKTFKEGDILVIPQTSNRILNIIKKASGIITESGGMNSHAAIVGLALDKPVIVAAEHATQILKSGTTVTLDAARAIVFSGKEKCGV